jgi:hypothetical protein
MINMHVTAWLLTGSVIGWLTVLERHFSIPALLVSLSFAMGAFVIFGLIRRQPTR